MSRLIPAGILLIVVLAVVSLSGCAGGGNNNAGPGTATPVPTLVPVSSMPKSYGDISDMSYILDNLRYIRMNNSVYKADQYYTQILIISNDPVTYKGKSCNRLIFTGNVTDTKGPDALGIGGTLNFSMELYATLIHGNISEVYGGYLSMNILGEPQEMEIPAGDRSISMAEMLRKETSPPVGEEEIFAEINSLPLINTGTGIVTIGKNNYSCYILDQLNVPQEVLDNEIVESHQINVTSFNVTFESGETKIISLVDDGMVKYWWYPPLAGFPLKTEISPGDDQKYILTVEEWR